ncbi:MAG TPA: glutamine-hydrolyzing GMP synthase [Gammaproteobacteria bacterium]|nr:glutamine-hydrolyzing GMP synthase [Gammaproteobacteria bacterium]
MSSEASPAASGAADARILILDYGAQYTQLIARRVREAGVYSEIYACDASPAAIKAFKPWGIILSGGPESAAAAGSPQVNEAALEAGVPLLGICYGMQALAARLGGTVAPAQHREYGYAEVAVVAENPLLSGLGDTSGSRYGVVEAAENGVAVLGGSSENGVLSQVGEPAAPLKVWMSHGDRVEVLPPGFVVIAASRNAPLAGIANLERRIFGLQFHPEVTHTEQGFEIIKRFVHDICGCPATWTPKNIIAEHIERIRKTVGNERVLLALSGGVDSSVVAALMHQAIGDRLVCVFVDHGLLRLHEADEVMELFARHLGVNVVKAEAEQTFLAALAGVADPEDKRKIIGRLFVEVFEAHARQLDDVRWLAQGTIYPDVIESAGAATGKAALIKSHHNVGGLPERMHLKLIEPLRDLFKDEVRRIGLELGLPATLIGRHPFPGPGLGVRILGPVEKEFADLLRRADDIFIRSLREQGLYDRVSQAFAVFLPVKSVGVMGDGRRYDYVVALRAVETVDFMTARWARLPYEFLDEVARRIINEVPGISRVTYDISGKPPATIEWE